jgi:hypothetical protein
VIKYRNEPREDGKCLLLLDVGKRGWHGRRGGKEGEPRAHCKGYGGDWYVVGERMEWGLMFASCATGLQNH